MKSEHVWAFLHSQKLENSPWKAGVNVHSLVQPLFLRAGKKLRKKKLGQYYDGWEGRREKQGIQLGNTSKGLPHISPSIRSPDSVFRSRVNLRVQLWPEKTGSSKMA